MDGMKSSITKINECPDCGQRTMKVWQDEGRKVVGMKCTVGHKEGSGERKHPVYLIVLDS